MASNSLAQLRRGGFEWPPPERQKQARHAPTNKVLDALFSDLKVARGELTAAELKYDAAKDAKARAEQALAEAERILAAARGEVDAAERLVQEAKAEFDEAFEARV